MLNCSRFREVFDHKVTEIQQVNQDKIEKELHEIKERSAVFIDRLVYMYANRGF